MNFNFGEVLSRAWHITWKHKVLWIFGILAGCAQSGGNANFNSNTSNFNSPGNNGFGNVPPQFLQWMETIEENIAIIIAVIVALTCILIIIQTTISIIGRIGLIRGAAQADDGAEKLSFGQLFRESLPYFWRVFGLNLIVGLPIFILFMAFALVIVFGIIGSAEGNPDDAMLAVFGVFPLMIACFCLLIPFMFVVGMIINQSTRGIILRDMSIRESLSHGWQIFRDNFGPLFLMTIIMVVLGGIVGLIIALPAFAIVFPTMLAFLASEGRNTSPLLLGGVLFCIYLPLAWLANGILFTYSESVWTITYLRLADDPDNDNTSNDIMTAMPESNA